MWHSVNTVRRSAPDGPRDRRIRALVATALAQALVPVIAVTIWRPPITSGVVGVVVVNAFFVALWVVSALLFRHADQPWSNNQGEGTGRGANRRQVAD